MAKTAAGKTMGWVASAILGIALAYVIAMARGRLGDASAISAFSRVVGNGELLGRSMGEASPVLSVAAKMAFHALGANPGALAWMGGIFYTAASLAIFALLRPVAGRNIAAACAFVCYASAALLVGSWWPASGAALLAAVFVSALARRGEIESESGAIVVATAALLLAAKPSLGIPLAAIGSIWLAAPRAMLGRQSWQTGACLLFLSPIAALGLQAAAGAAPASYASAIAADMGWGRWDGAAVLQSISKAAPQANWREWASLPGVLGVWMRAWLAFSASFLAMLAIGAMAWSSKKGPSFDFESNESRSMFGLGLFGMVSGFLMAAGGSDLPQASLPLVAAGCAILSAQHRMSKIQLRLCAALCLLVAAQCWWLGGSVGKTAPAALEGISQLAKKASDAAAMAAAAAR